MTLYDPQVRRAFERAAATYDAAAVVQREVVSRMAERLELIRLNPARILDLGSGTGQAAGFLRQRFPRAWVLEMDLAPAMLRHSRRHLAFWQRWRRRQSWLAADMHALPLATGSVDMVWSSMALQWARDLKPVLLELRRVLKPGGLLMFSSVGPDTFKELRQAFAAIDAAAHVNHFLDMHDVGDALLAAGFDVPVVDMEYLSLTYAEARDVMRDIKSVGAQRVTEGARIRCWIRRPRRRPPRRSGTNWHRLAAPPLPRPPARVGRSRRAILRVQVPR